jgi:hypothetical protein
MASTYLEGLVGKQVQILTVAGQHIDGTVDEILADPVPYLIVDGKLVMLHGIVSILRTERT